MNRRTSIVVTTIFQPAFLDGYLDNLRIFGREPSTTLYVIVDRKTPAAVSEAAERARRAGFDVRCPTLSEQVAFLRRVGLSEDFVPWDTDNRRNVGFLMALESGCDVLISIDDDNYCRSGSDFVGEHGRVGSAPAATEERPGEGFTGVFGPFFNVCTLLETRPAVAVFPRGFPHYVRKGAVSSPAGTDEAGGIIGINAGLWLADPDVDAVTRLAVAPEATAFKGRSVVLGSLWTPLNTQNTALTREAAEAYYYVRMGFELQGLRIDRYGDILSGYLTQKCAKHLGQTVRIGTPVADHRRTPHNLFKDLHQELAGMVLLEELLPWLIEERLEGANYLEVYLSLAERMAAATSRFTGFVWDDGGREFLVETARLMTEWSGVVKRLG